jgi:hypothetical protein
MHDERLSGIEIRKEIFCPAEKSVHGATAQALDEMRREGDSQVAAARLRPRYPAVLQDGSKAQTHGFDFGKFRHQGSGIMNQEGRGM